MGLLAKLFLGGGSLTPEMHAALASEGLVLIEEGLSGSIVYKHFKAPGKSFHGKIVPVRVGLGISERRVVMYASNGKAKLVDVPFGDPRTQAIDVSLDGENTVAIHVDYDRHPEAEAKRISGQVTLRAKTPNAATIVDHLRARLEAHTP